MSLVPSRPPARRSGLLTCLRHDGPAGLVVFLVALPLCLGVALACGVPLVAGLVTGVLGGCVVSWLSGSELSVSGPTAGLVVIVVDALSTLGSFQAFLVAVVLAGMLQWLMGHLRLGVIASCLPSPVVKGVLAAIGVVLVVKQVPVVLGFATGSPALGFWPDDASAIDAWNAALDAVTPEAVAVALGSLAILFAWDSAAIRGRPCLGRLPAPLLVVLWGAGFHALHVRFHGATLFASHQRVVLPAFESWGGWIAGLPRPDWRVLRDPGVYLAAASVAAVASLETLLSLEAADRQDPQRRISSPDRELKAQGIGNVLAGLLGGLPMAAAIVRTSANVQAGARSRLSSALHGTLLLASWVFLADLLQWVPLAALSAILLFTGAKLVRPALIVSAWRQGARSFVPFVATLASILCTDQLLGTLIGLATSVIFLLRECARGAVESSACRGVHQLRFNKDVSFFCRFAVQRALNAVRAGESLEVDGSRAQAVDPDIRDLLEDFRRTAAERGIQVRMHGLPAAGLRAGAVDPRPWERGDGGIRT